MHVDDKGQFGGDSDHHPFFIVLKEQTCVKKMFKQLVPDKIVWDIKENQDWTEYASDVIVRSASLDSTSVDSLYRTMGAVIHGAMHKTIGTKMVSVKRLTKLPKVLVDELRYKKQLGHEYKILLCQHERDKSSVPGSLPTYTLLTAKDLFESQCEKVKLLLKERNKSIRRINIESCTGGSPTAQRRFWSFVTNKVKKKSDINCVQSEVDGSLKYNQDSIILEIEQFLKTLFEGEFDHITPPINNVPSTHNYARDQNETPAPRKIPRQNLPLKMGEKNLNKDFTNTRRGHHFEKFFLKISSFF